MAFPFLSYTGTARGTQFRNSESLPLLFWEGPQSSKKPKSALRGRRGSFGFPDDEPTTNQTADSSWLRPVTLDCHLTYESRGYRAVQLVNSML
jgi:hypothetical protein